MAVLAENDNRFMSDTGERGIARRQLVLIGLDFSSESNEQMLSECIDAWGLAGLLEDVYFVDLGTEVGSAADFQAAVQFQCARPGQDELIPLERVLSSHIWAEIVLVSIRLSPLARVFSERVGQEEKIKRDVVRAFPRDSGCRTGFFTLSWLNDESFSDGVFPQGFTTNLLHDRSIYVGEELAVAPFDERNRHLSLAFTALIAAGGFVGQESSALINLVEPDGRMGLGSVVRPIRAIARAASGGWFFRDALRQAMSRENFIMPGGVVNAVPDSGSPVVIENLVSQVAEMCEFLYSPHKSQTSKEKKMGFFQALMHFLRNIWPYIRRSGRHVVAEKLSKALEPFADALQSVYGSNSIVAIRGTSGVVDDGMNNDIVRLLQYLVQNPNELALEPVIKPEVWRNLAKVVVGSLDGSDLPEKITCLSRGGRIIFNDPLVVAPSAEASVFRLSKADLVKLGLEDSTRLREPDILFPETIENFRSIIAKAKQESIFAAPTSSSSTFETPDEPSATKIRSRLIGGNQNLNNESKPNETSAYPSGGRDVRKISEDFEKWLPTAKERARSSFFFKLADLLEMQSRSAMQDVKVEELKRLLDEMIQDGSKKSRSKLRLVLGGIGVAGIFGVIAATQLSWVSLALLPLLVIWLVIWLFSAAVGLVAGVLKRAIRDYREDHGKAEESGVQFLFNSSKTAMREYIRLRSLQSQFFAWSRILREVIHSPYGSQTDDSEKSGDITDIPHPRQFAIAKVEPLPRQMQNLLNSIRRTLLVRGYLDAVLEGTIGVWRERYREFALQGINQDPFADVRQTWGQAVSERMNGELVYYPLQDYFEDLVHRDLREVAARALQAEIENRFNSLEVREVFGQITDVDPDHLALKDFSPEEYLFDYLGRNGYMPGALRQDFNIDLFNMRSSRALQLRQSNVDQARCVRSATDNRNLRNFSLRRNRRFIMLTHLVAIGEQAGPNDLSGYESQSPSSEQGSSWKE
jgi:hypothetical protein